MSVFELTAQSSLFPSPLKLSIPTKYKNPHSITTARRSSSGPLIKCCSSSNSSSSTEAAAAATTTQFGSPVIKKRKKLRNVYPGERKGITEEMRFVAMRLRNIKGDYPHKTTKSKGDTHYSEDDDAVKKEKQEEKNGDGDGETWVPSMEGFVKYLVDSKLVFDTVERIVDKSDDVSYTYFRKTGLERSGRLAKDLEWFSQQDIAIPEPGKQGVFYAKYLEELAEKSVPLFLCHVYNIYFSHIAGGQVITRKVSEILLQGRDLEFNRWEGNVQELLKGVREKLNKLGEHWSRDEKKKCLFEAAKSFKYMGQIVRLIIQ